MFFSGIKTTVKLVKISFITLNFRLQNEAKTKNAVFYDRRCQRFANTYARKQKRSFQVKFEHSRTARSMLKPKNVTNFSHKKTFSTFESKSLCVLCRNAPNYLRRPIVGWFFYWWWQRRSRAINYFVFLLCVAIIGIARHHYRRRHNARPQEKNTVKLSPLSCVHIKKLFVSLVHACWVLHRNDGLFYGHKLITIAASQKKENNYAK